MTSTTSSIQRAVPKPMGQKDSSTLIKSDTPTSSTRAVVYVIDSDEEVCNALRSLFAGLNADVECFNSAESFLKLPLNRARAGCVLLEVNLPGMSGVELLERFQKTGFNLPTIVLATYSDVPTAVRAMQAKAVDFIEKPFVDGVLLRRVKEALESQQP